MIYLDNAASAPITSTTLDFFKQQAISNFANQEAIHKAGYDIRKVIKNAENRLISHISSDNSSAKVQFIASGTDALNLTLKYPFSGNIITTSVEHPALSQAIERQENCEVRKVRISQNGLIDLERLEELIDDKTSLLAIHHIHSETGIIQPLCEIRKILNGKKSKAKFLVDTIQSANKLKIPWDEAQIDFAYIAAHKIGAPAGGIIIYRNDKNLSQFFINAREKEHSIGRTEPSLELTLIESFIQNSINSDALYQKINAFNKCLRKELEKIKLVKNKILFPVSEYLASPFILNFIVPNYQAGVLLRMLSEKNIMISSGTACEAESKAPSKTLTEMKYNKELAFGALRLSMWTQTTEDDINTFLKVFSEIIKNY